ncbi:MULTISPECIES: peptidylprolyl isomerase [unclassified Nostoc]|uniref:peptidylprolyl isomerase n=1 Tax=unclassified Nostoc TaxID=2593658 RepID=UPI0013CF9AF8|nr:MULTISPECIES: peptidylprolyl isomerase [unclassified Nostoc]MBE9002134.1 peptidylprolyl isomerase [Nostoc sp. LEGE 12447]NEU82447.1 peptidylprolyl isomerase [Nostoc sp. UIC 10630]
MNKSLQIGEHALLPNEILPFLASYNLIPQLLSQSIIESAIAPITCTLAETTQALEQFYQQWNLTTEQKIQDWCLRYGLTQEQLELFATRKLRVEKFKQITWGHQLESYFLKYKRHFDKVIYSLIRTDNRGTANELYFRITEGEQSFAELAHEYSQGPEAETSGIIGPVEVGTITPNFAQLLCTSQVGIVQAPVAFGESWVIVRVEKFITAQLDNFMRQRLLQENFETWFQQQLSELSPEEKTWMGINTKPAHTQQAIAA